MDEHTIFQRMAFLSRTHREIQRGEFEESTLPGKAWFINEQEIVAIPNDENESRYLYRDGLNLWAAASGYMHCNNGMLTVIFRSEEGQEPRIA